MTKHRAGPHCSIDVAHWSRYLDREFSSAECRRCEAHLDDCPECRARLGDLRRTIRACRQAGRTPVPSEIKARARQRVRAVMAEAAASPPRRHR